VDASRVHLFDPEDGRSLTTDAAGPAAVDGGGGQPQATPAPAEGTQPPGAAGGTSPPPAEPR
jgi:hypothetical protein